MDIINLAGTYDNVTMRPVSVDAGQVSEDGKMTAHVKPAKDAGEPFGVVYGTILSNCLVCVDYKNNQCSGLVAPIRQLAGRGQGEMREGASHNYVAQRITPVSVPSDRDCQSPDTTFTVPAVPSISRHRMMVSYE